MREADYEQQEIDLLDLAWRLLEQWRGLLISGLAVALLGMLIFGLRDTATPNPADASTTSESASPPETAMQQDIAGQSSAQAQQIPEDEMPVKAEIDPATVLTFDPGSEYWIACNDLALYADYNTIKSINENNIVTRCDFSQCDYVVLVYEFLVEGDSKDVLKVGNLYSGIMGNGDFIESVAHFVSEEADPNTLSDILSVGVSTNTNNGVMKNGTVSFTATIPKNIEIDDWSRTLNSALVSYKKQVVDSVSAHSIKSVAINTRKGTSASLIKVQNTKQTEIRNAKTAYENAMLNTSAETKKIVSKLIDENRDARKYTDLRARLDEKWQKYADEVVKKQESELKRLNDEAEEIYREELANIAAQEALTREEAAKAEAAKAELEKAEKEKAEKDKIHQDPPESEAVKLTKRFFIGFLAGIFLYCFAYMMIFIFVRVIRGEEELHLMSGLRNFGGIYEYPYKKSWQKFLFDKRIYEIRRRRRKTCEQISEDLFVKLSHNDIKDISVISLGEISEETGKISDQLIECLKNKGIKVNCSNIPGYIDSETDSVYASMSAVFLELVAGRTRVENIKKLHSKLCEYDVPIIGYCYIEV